MKSAFSFRITMVTRKYMSTLLLQIWNYFDSFISLNSSLLGCSFLTFNRRYTVIQTACHSWQLLAPGRSVNVALQRVCVLRHASSDIHSSAYHYKKLINFLSLQHWGHNRVQGHFYSGTSLRVVFYFLIIQTYRELLLHLTRHEYLILETHTVSWARGSSSC